MKNTARTVTRRAKSKRRKNQAPGAIFRDQLAMVLAPRTQLGDRLAWASLEFETVYLDPASRTARTATAAQMLSTVPQSPWHADGAHWPAYVLEFGPKVLLEAMATLQEMGNLTTRRSSVLGILGTLVSTGIRREVLRDLLVKTNFNLGHVAELCRLSGPANVIREIRALGLGPLYDERRKSGAVKQGVRRARQDVPSVPLVPRSPTETA